ncbi:hypothetical protein quinque_013837 [Culex quinquefasciatus]
MYNIRERDCTVDAYRLLNEYADDGGANRRLQQRNNLPKKARQSEKRSRKTFRCWWKSKPKRPNGEEIGPIRRDETETNKKKSCNILRLMPIDVITKANLKDTIGDAGSLFERYFVREPKTFVIIFHRRLNNGLERESVITGLAEMNRDNKANLKHPELAVIVELIKGLTLISIVPQFSQLQMYNLMEIFT